MKNIAKAKYGNFLEVDSPTPQSTPAMYNHTMLSKIHKKCSTLQKH